MKIEFKAEAADGFCEGGPNYLKDSTDDSKKARRAAIKLAVGFRHAPRAPATLDLWLEQQCIWW